MNTEHRLHPIEDSARQILADLVGLTRREPIKVAAAAFAAGVLINLLPRKAVARVATAVGATLLHPALLSLGVVKAMEWCCQRRQEQVLSPVVALPTKPLEADLVVQL